MIAFSVLLAAVALTADSPPCDPTPYDLEANAAYHEGDWARALSLYRQGRRCVGDGTRGHDFQIARALFQLGRVREAIDLFAAVERGEGFSAEMVSAAHRRRLEAERALTRLIVRLPTGDDRALAVIEPRRKGAVPMRQAVSGGSRVVLDPGPHRVRLRWNPSVSCRYPEARLDEKLVARGLIVPAIDVTLSPGQTRTLALECGEPPPSPSTPVPVRATFYSGVTLAAVGVVLLTIGQVEDHDVATGLPTSPADLASVSQVEASEGVTRANALTAAGGAVFGVGAGLLVSSLVLRLTLPLESTIEPSIGGMRVRF